MTITSSNIPFNLKLHACTSNGHVMGHVMDVITCIAWWSLPLQSHYIQNVIHVSPLHAPKDANSARPLSSQPPGPDCRNSISALTSGILYPWTGLGEMVRNGMYQYVPLTRSTRQYRPVQEFPVCTY